MAQLGRLKGTTESLTVHWLDEDGMVGLSETYKCQFWEIEDSVLKIAIKNGRYLMIPLTSFKYVELREK